MKKPNRTEIKTLASIVCKELKDYYIQKAELRKTEVIDEDKLSNLKKVLEELGTKDYVAQSMVDNTQRTLIQEDSECDHYNRMANRYCAPMYGRNKYCPEYQDMENQITYIVMQGIYDAKEIKNLVKNERMMEEDGGEITKKSLKSHINPRQAGRVRF